MVVHAKGHREIDSRGAPHGAQVQDITPQCQTREPLDALRRHGREDPEGKEAQITDAQRARNT